MFIFEIKVPAKSQEEATKKLQSAAVMIEKLDVSTLQKMSETVSNPIKLAAVKLKLGI